MKRVVHMGPKSQFGGWNEGFTSWANQDPDPVTVKKDPRLPSTRQKSIAATSFGTDRTFREDTISIPSCSFFPLIILMIEHPDGGRVQGYSPTAMAPRLR